ncbi:MAG: hypothetical protein GY856_39625 [bacterium]|nr:hypothetical protein [bacterium]
MINTFRQRIMVLLIASHLAAVLALASTGDPVELDYQRGPVQRPEASKPFRSLLPEVLRIGQPGGAAADPSARSDQPAPYSASAQRIDQAAAEAAHELSESAGRRQAHRVGFFDGLHNAMQDRFLGRWDYHAGIDRGRGASEAQRSGAQIGYRAAHSTAEQTAFEQVTEQFFDLSGEARLEPQPVVPPFADTSIEVPRPRLEEVFRDHPLAGDPASDDVDSPLDPWQFYCSIDHHDFYDGRWTDPRYALDYWLQQHRDESSRRQLSPEEEAQFKQGFQAAYRRWIAHHSAAVVRRAYRDGFARGWSYGARINYEWSYRQGYYEGFSGTVRATAEKTYLQSYPRVFDERYHEYSYAWSTTEDLDNRYLLEYMVKLARSSTVDPSDVSRAQKLMLRRLRVDWEAVVDRRGNPYKIDLVQGTRTTALGDLVGTYRADRDGIRHQKVFTQLAPRIETLAKSLPGFHPFLRRYVRRLGSELRF